MANAKPNPNIIPNAKPIDNARGRTTELDKWGNDGEDSLAVRGAQVHRVPETFVYSHLDCENILPKMYRK